MFTGLLLDKTGEYDLVCFNFLSLLPSFLFFFLFSPFPPLKKHTLMDFRGGRTPGPPPPKSATELYMYNVFLLILLILAVPGTPGAGSRNFPI